MFMCSRKDENKLEKISPAMYIFFLTTRLTHNLNITPMSPI